MTYKRAIPRDLFNEADLLKCYGQLYLELERHGMADCLIHKAESDYFRVRQDPADGSLTLANVLLVVRGQSVPLRRPLNARSKYPLWTAVEGDERQVFDQHGGFSEDMLIFLGIV